MISDLFLKRAENIRKDYHKLRYELDRYDRLASQLAVDLENRMGDLKKLLTDIESKKVNNINAGKEKLNTIMIELERNINNVDSKIRHVNEKMDQLKIDEQSLYKELKQKYPNKSDDELKNEIINHLKQKGIS